LNSSDPGAKLPGMANVLGDFITFLEESRELNQSEIARRAHLSQAVVNKAVQTLGHREPAAETYRALAEAFPSEWTAFLEAHPEYQAHLTRLYGWAFPAKIKPPTSDAARRLSAIEAELLRLLQLARTGKAARRGPRAAKP
jgi:transcriptional regulator with XRE-family HTH domain